MTRDNKKTGFLSRLLSRDESTPPQTVSPFAIESKLVNLEKEVRKLGKTQFKANILAESKATQEADALKGILSAQDEQSDLLQNLGKKQSAQTRSELLSAILPVLDGLEHARVSGQSYLKIRDVSAQKADLTPEQAVLVSPADRAMLAGWLKGLALINERLLAILSAGDVTPIPSIGHPFDPYLHIAVGTVANAAPEFSPGTIVAEEQCGYRTSEKVLRFAEVIVYKPKKVDAVG